jgi:hypothetical protein
MGQMVVVDSGANGNVSNPDSASRYAYTPDGVNAALVGAGTISIDVQIGVINPNDCFKAGLMLQQNSPSEQYGVELQYNGYGPTNALAIGCFTEDYNWDNAPNHAPTVYLALPDITSGWWHITAVIGTDVADGNPDWYRVDATATNLSDPGTTYSLTYIDQTFQDANNDYINGSFLTSEPVGLMTANNGCDSVTADFDNFSIVTAAVPEPATLAFLLFGGLTLAAAGLRRRLRTSGWRSGSPPAP